MNSIPPGPNNFMKIVPTQIKATISRRKPKTITVEIRFATDLLGGLPRGIMELINAKAHVIASEMERLGKNQ